MRAEAALRTCARRLATLKRQEQRAVREKKREKDAHRSSRTGEGERQLLRL